MKNLLLKIEYDGTVYKGWQRQPQTPTIEEYLKQSLEIICQRSVKITVSSRTDSGVHALGQVANVKVPQNISLRKLFFSLNSLLPADIAVLDILEAPIDYKARSENKGKRYSYHILNSPIPRAIGNNFFLWVKNPLNLKIMEQACSLLIGKHDFSAFRGQGCQQLRTVKDIHKAELECSRDGIFTGIKIIVEGSSFLKNMVRIMAGTLIDIGVGKLQPEVIPLAFASGKRKILGMTAPAKGLRLEKVFFRPDPFVERKLDAWNK